MSTIYIVLIIFACIIATSIVNSINGISESIKTIDDRLYHIQKILERK